MEICEIMPSAPSFHNWALHPEEGLLVCLVWVLFLFVPLMLLHFLCRIQVTLALLISLFIFHVLECVCEDLLGIQMVPGHLGHNKTPLVNES